MPSRPRSGRSGKCQENGCKAGYWVETRATFGRDLGGRRRPLISWLFTSWIGKGVVLRTQTVRAQTEQKDTRRIQSRIKTAPEINPHSQRAIRSYKGTMPLCAPSWHPIKVVLVCRYRLREPPRSHSDSKRPVNNDLFLRSERQCHPKDDRRRNHNISLGLCKPSHRSRLWRRDHYLRLRRFRLPRLPDPRPRPPRSIPSSGTPSPPRRAAALSTRPPRSTCSMVTPSLYHRPAIRERRSDRHCPNPLHPPRPPRLHQCRDQRKRHGGADT